MNSIKRCTRCIMDDNSDSFITFDENGFCNYCTTAFKQIGTVYFPNELGEKKLQDELIRIKKYGEGKKYDCIMGLSGGIDSSYLAYLGYKWGLRVLAIHVDDGYDTDISKENIRKLVEKTGFDYEVITPDKEQYNALILAFMKAGVPNIAVPQDNVLFAFLYDRMKKYGIKYFLSGGNFALECILQQGNTHSAMDVVNIKDINTRFGTKPTNKLKFISTIQTLIDSRILGIKSPRLLNFIDYNRDRAFAELKEFCGFEYYGRKHLENILTAFAQLYWFPKKFGVDKRTSHLSSMIVSGQITREEALKQYEEPLYDEEMMENYISVICKNMDISRKEFDKVLCAKTHQHDDYKTQESTIIYKALRCYHHFRTRKKI